MLDVEILEGLVVLERKVMVSLLVELDLYVSALADSCGQHHLFLLADQDAFGLDGIAGVGERTCDACRRARG